MFENIFLPFSASESESKIGTLRSEIGSFEAKIKQIQSELDVQRGKNDVSGKEEQFGSHMLFFWFILSGLGNVVDYVLT